MERQRERVMKRFVLVPLLFWMVGCSEPPKPQPVVSQAVDNVTPSLTVVAPATTTAATKFNVQSDGTSAFGVNGGGFERGSAIVVNGQRLPSIFGNSEWLTATMPAGLYDKPGVLTVKVINPNGKESNSMEFTVTPKK